MLRNLLSAAVQSSSMLFFKLSTAACVAVLQCAGVSCSLFLHAQPMLV
jgi:hypothetical protein